MSLLFEPIRIRSVDFRNRIVVSPMCQYSSKEGFANDWHLVHLGSRAVGGAGLVMQEATAVSPEGRISPDDMGIWKDDHIEKLNQITSFIAQHGAVPGIQIAHAGRKASHASPWKGSKLLSPQEGGWNRVSPSEIPFRESEEAPSGLSNEGIKTIVKRFVDAAKRAQEAGFKVIEIHAAHGYLVHEFLSPLCNHRKDEYGGSFENRTRFLIEVVDNVRNVLDDSLPLFVRISASDWAEGGWNIEESIRLASLLKGRGVDLIDCSSGGAVAHQQIKTGPGYQVPFSEAIKSATGMLTGAVGLITTAHQAEEILTNHQADMIFLGREMLRDPYFPVHAAKALGHDIVVPSPYERAK